MRSRGSPYSITVGTPMAKRMPITLAPPEEQHLGADRAETGSEEGPERGDVARRNLGEQGLTGRGERPARAHQGLPEPRAPVLRQDLDAHLAPARQSPAQDDDAS